MKSMISAGLMALIVLAGNAQAAEQTAQQNKMVTCNKQAGDKKGDERAAFMKQCLSSKKTTSTRSHRKSTSTSKQPKKTTTATTTSPTTTTATPTEQ